jgi:2,5-diketo-D-gluconate reductase B
MENFLGDYPRIGLGTWENTDREECINSVREGIKIGYRHIDTAQFYKNEEYVGEGIAQASVDRDELFVATKVWFKNMRYDDVIKSTEESLEKLGLDYVDCLYVHWPSKPYSAEETMPAFEELKKQGLIKYIGVSNFTIDLLKEAREVLSEPVFANQVEMHPLLQQADLREFQNEENIKLVAYSPFRHGTIFNNDTLEKIADKHNVSVARVCLAWQLSKQNVLPIPKARGEEHLRDNFLALQLELSPEDIALIDSIGPEDRYIDPPFGPWN